MKKIIIRLSVLILIGIAALSYFIFFKKEPITTVINVKKDATAIYGSFVNPNEFISELTDGEKIDNELVLIDDYPTKNITIKYLDSNKDKQKIDVNIKVIDSDKPTIMNARTITVNVGEEPDFKNNVMIGDNADRNPKVEVIGDYNINKTGTYSVKYRVTDAAGNQAEQWFKISVIRKSNNNGGGYAKYDNYYFDKFIEEYKTDKTSLGIDVSKWQGDINWNKVKDAGCEFAIIRVGYQKGKNGEMVVDPYFEKNIKGANKVGIPVGIYFYSYAGSKDEATKQAKWISKQIKDYKVELPIAFDWENWTSFGTYNLNFLDMNQIAQTYIDELQKEGYKGMLYSSKSYLEAIWNDFDTVWLAHYTKNTNYQGDYLIWQMSNVGRISGIAGDVDLDVMYKK
jgi:GH25 family lysozyme M1 (1,4-beta-N-acetylmuramidase)